MEYLNYDLSRVPQKQCAFKVTFILKLNDKL